MHAMAGSTVGNNLRSAALGESVVAVGVGRNPVGGQIVTQRQAFIAVASPASGHRDARRVHQRSLLLRSQDQVLPMAVTANRGGGHARLHRLSVHTFKICLANFRVALATRRRDIPVVGPGTRIFRGKDAVAPVTIRAACGRPVSIHNGSSVHALFIEFYRMRERNLVPREKLLVAVTSSASIRQMFLSYQRSGIARGLNLMHRPMAGHAARCVRIACRSCLSMYARPEFLDFIGVALRTLCRRRLPRSRDFVWIAVAGLASCFAGRVMNAASYVRSLVGMASRALNLRHFRRVRKILDGRVAIVAAQNAVDTGRMFGGINRDAFAAGRGHPRLAVAGQAAFILLQWMRRFRLGASPSRCQHADCKKSDRKKPH